MSQLLKSLRQLKGFSLVEMAIVLTIVGLLMATLLPSLSAQIEQQRRAETKKYMEDVRNALIGYAVINEYLPCPDTDGDGASNTPCQDVATKQFGTLPYKDLGVTSADAFGVALVYGVSKKFADSSAHFTLSDIGTMRVCTTQSCSPSTTILTSAAPAVLVSRGPNWALTPSSDETENTDSATSGDLDFVSHDIASDFDDLVVWLSSNSLANRMVAAGKLP